jgi:pilus assembly protein CpaC
MKNPIFSKFRRSRSLVSALALCFIASGLVSPQMIYAVDGNAMDEAQGFAEIHLIRGDLETITVEGLERVSVSNPDVADVVDADGNKVLMLAKQPGQTAVFLWDAGGKKTYIVRVFEHDLKLIETRLEELLDRANLNGVYLNSNTYEGKVILTGSLPLQKKDELERLVEPFQASVLNLVKEENIEDLVQIDVQIMELNASVSEEIGLDWQDAITVTETTPAFDGGVGDLFKIGDFGRSNLAAVVNMLVTEGKGRVLSKPKLVVVSGKEASFLVGGEVPVTSTTTLTSGAQQENVEYRDFGVSLTITPIVKENSKVDILLQVEVSELDPTNSIGSNFAFTTRTAQTQLVMDDEQTIVLAGLIKQNENETVSKIPFLGDIPILGLLFRNREKPSSANTDTELFISLTPKILRQSVKKTAKAVPSSEPAKTPTQTLVSMKSSSTSPAISEGMNRYIHSIQQSIASAVMYPDEALENGWEGTVRLALHVLKDGTLANAAVTESSGYSLFDDGALMAAKTTAPFTGFPSDANLQEINVTVPIVYSLGANR